MPARRPIVIVNGRKKELSPPDFLPLDILPGGVGSEGVVVGTPIPDEEDMLPGVAYFDFDCKEAGGLDSNGVRCVEYFGQGSRVVLSQRTGRLLLSQGGFFRTRD